jgi:proteasome lid subunit RPN8/RPN11
MKTSIAAHALEEYPRECCGLVVGGRYVPCRNVHEHPTESFVIAPEDYAAAEDMGEITALVHSHPGATARPSQADLVECEAAGIPSWVIVSLGAQANGSIAIEDWYEFGPTGYEAPLVGCEFSHGTNDCYGLVRRYFKQTHGIALPDFDRSGEWWKDGHSDLYTQNFPAAGFVAQPRGSDPQIGDVLLMQIRSSNGVPNHAAVYLGDGTILHHCWGQLSRRDQLARYSPYVTHVLRHEELIR